MEVAEQKPSDLMNLQVALAETKGKPSLEERLATALAVVAMLASVYLLFREFDLTGVTWDEWMDFEIARDYHHNQSFLTNLQDPSQARFSHLVAAGSFALFGESYFTFKLPFALAGFGAGVWLWRFLLSLVRPTVAALVAAMYFTCPYVLAASRTGATAGDALVLATTVGFVITLYRWLLSERFWPYGAACGICCGLAIGSKWTGATLLGAVFVAWLLHLRRQQRRIWDGKVWVAILAHQWITVGLAVLASPTLLLGLPFIKSSLGHSMDFAGIELLQFGEMRAKAPFYYVPAVLVSKLSPVQLLVCLYELVVIVSHWLLRRRNVGLLASTLLLSLFPVIPLALKGFQNAHYYLAVVPTVMVLSAIALERWMRSRRGQVRRLALWSALAALVGQLGLSIYLTPDYLLAGRQFGEFFYGQFAGPAVNHCQGLPFAIREVNQLVETENGPRAVYLLRSCVGILPHVVSYGPVKPLSPIAADPGAPIPHEHFLIIPTSYDYDLLGKHEASVFAERKLARVRNCEPAGEGHVDYELWRCPPYTPQ